MPEISMFCPVCGRAVQFPGPETAVLPPAGSRSDSLLGALAYATPLPAIVFLAVPALRASRFVRFQCWQSILFTLGTILAGILLRLIFATLAVVPWVGFLLAWLSIGLGSLAIVVLWAVLTVKAAQGQGFEIPGLAQLALHLSDWQSTG